MPSAPRPLPSALCLAAAVGCGLLLEPSQAANANDGGATANATSGGALMEVGGACLRRQHTPSCTGASRADGETTDPSACQQAALAGYFEWGDSGCEDSACADIYKINDGLAVATLMLGIQLAFELVMCFLLCYVSNRKMPMEGDVGCMLGGVCSITTLIFQTVALVGDLGMRQATQDMAGYACTNLDSEQGRAAAEALEETRAKAGLAFLQIMFPYVKTFVCWGFILYKCKNMQRMASAAAAVPQEQQRMKGRAEGALAGVMACWAAWQLYTVATTDGTTVFRSITEVDGTAWCYQAATGCA